MLERAVSGGKKARDAPASPEMSSRKDLDWACHEPAAVSGVVADRRPGGIAGGRCLRWRFRVAHRAPGPRAGPRADTGSRTAPDPAPAPDLLLPDDPSAVVLEVWVSGGLLPPEYSLNFPPIYWLTAGGTLYSEGSPPPIAPPPLLASLNETELAPAQLEAALDEIAASGLPEAGEEHISAPSGLAPEILTTELIFRDTAGDHVIRVEGLHAGMDTHPDPRVPHLLALLEVFEEAIMDFTPYLGDRLQVITVFDVPRSEPPDRDERAVAAVK